jgi:hypothetical protein
VLVGRHGCAPAYSTLAWASSAGSG